MACAFNCGVNHPWSTGPTHVTWAAELVAVVERAGRAGWAREGVAVPRLPTVELLQLSPSPTYCSGVGNSCRHLEPRPGNGGERRSRSDRG
eukprot:353021-Chlamydomonas_euryale.AAC.5